MSRRAFVLLSITSIALCLESTYLSLQANDTIFESSYTVTGNFPSYSVNSSCLAANGYFIVGKDVVVANSTFASVNTMAAARFLNVLLPFNTSILSAKLVLANYQHFGGGLTFRIYGQSSSNAPSFSNNPHCISNLQLTNASVEVSATAIDKQGNATIVGLESILQEITGSITWRKGNSIMVVAALQSTQDDPTSEISVSPPGNIYLDIIYKFDECANINCTAPFFCNDSNTSGLSIWKCVYNLCIVNSSSCPVGYTCTDPNPIQYNISTKHVVCTLDECSIGNGGCPLGMDCIDTDLHNPGGIQCSYKFYPFINSTKINGVIVSINNNSNMYNDSVLPEYINNTWDVWFMSKNNPQTPQYPGYVSRPGFPLVYSRFTVNPLPENYIDNNPIDMGIIQDTAPLLLTIDLSQLTPPVTLLYLDNSTGNFVDISNAGSFIVIGQTMTVTISNVSSFSNTFALLSQISTQTPLLNTTVQVTCSGNNLGYFGSSLLTNTGTTWYSIIYNNYITLFQTQNLIVPLVPLQRVMVGNTGRLPIPNINNSVYNVAYTIQDFYGGIVQKFPSRNVTVVQYTVARGTASVQNLFIAAMNVDTSPNIGNPTVIVEQVQFKDA